MLGVLTLKNGILSSLCISDGISTGEGMEEGMEEGEKMKQLPALRALKMKQPPSGF